MRLLLLAIISPVLIFGCAEKSETTKEIKLKMYDVRYKNFQGVEEVLIERYKNTPAVKELTFNGYDMSVEVVADAKRVEYGDKIYTAEFGSYNPSSGKDEKFVKKSDANVLILRIEFKRSVDGIAHPKIDVKSNLFFVLFGVPISGVKKITLTKVEPRIVFEDGFVEPWNFALEKDKV